MPMILVWETMKLDLPNSVKKVFEILDNSGFCGYLVGGSVRDCLLEKTPLDFDMTSDATPAEIKDCFSNYRVIETGIRHGTVTVIIDGHSIEITTHRREGNYSDKRHPDEVMFTKNLDEDLARRDFTMNALAYHPQKGFVDLFGGIEDIQEKRIRCVGDPRERMNEDALRILRALRFSSVLGFALEEETQKAINEACEQLKEISAERVAVELVKLLCGKNVKKVLLEETTVLGVVIPELLPAKDFDQKNPHHCYDILTHTAVALENLPPTPHLRWTMLFHDLGKPETYSRDALGIGHFNGHSRPSESLAKHRLNALKLDKESIAKICKLIKYHDTVVEPSKRSVKRWLNRLSEALFRDLLEIKRADVLAQSLEYRFRLDGLAELENILSEVIAENECFSLKDLAINGNDLIAMGIADGPEIGQLLKHLLENVMDDEVENAKEVLIEKIKEIKQC